MAATDEQRALQRELLLARAAAERAALSTQLDGLRTRTATPGGVARLVFSGVRVARGHGPFGLAAQAVRLARTQPWLVPAVVGVGAKLARSRTLRWLAIAGAAGAAWWWYSQRDTAASDADEAGVADAD
jgi:hypothetical protein